jgi:hypothetical protein
MCLSQSLLAQSSPVYSYSYEPSTDPGDSIPDLYIVFSLSDIMGYKKLELEYNSKKFTVEPDNLSLLSATIYFERDSQLYIKIPERLETPFVLVEGEGQNGNFTSFSMRDSRGKVSDPWMEKQKWEKHKTRVDSMDYLRRYDKFYIGSDGQPRFKDKDGTIYIIKKDHVTKEKN